ncbi:Molybdopterin oxidoreductase [Caenispirillum salinarum AK4]|uniref:Molybdopterin oxidoreductase n=1 Tax=Caenispirillum salinarum AK4 TaxID=1238182 RepID=K9HGE1_9PROT|nr:quinol:electron acceptor oxidoreductase subunit ActD [Caenispirillum salinarum]EKV29533.1 Molybdopterin oxidoreductase [Caenispirillum salinarum AK4]
MPGNSIYPRGTTYRGVGDRVASILLDLPTRRRWWTAFLVSGALFLFLPATLVHLFIQGVGVWGVNIPVNWGLAIVNVVWWIGIGHAGTFISAMLLLLGQDWRNSLNRFAEAMTIFAVICAAMYPIIHLGRPQFFYWMLPYPTPFEVWPQFRSPLFWDVMAISTYFTVSLLFWYVGLIPDLASVRDKAKGRFWRVALGLAALGWRGSAMHWVRWRRAYVMLAALAMPLVVSVHSGVSLLFAAGPVPGWHTTIYPPYFVMGALFSGFAVVGMIAVTLRAWFKLYDLVTPRHLDLLAKFMLAIGLMTAYGYLFEALTAWTSGHQFEVDTLRDRLIGPFAPIYWGAVILNFAPIQMLWRRRWRTRPVVLFLVCLSVTVGMWLERYMLIISGLFRDYLPSSWGTYSAPWTEWLLFLGTIGFFLFAFVLFIRFLPMVAISEVKEVLFEERPAKRPAPEPAPRAAEPTNREPARDGLYGVLACYDRADDLVLAARRAVAGGFTRLDCHTPFPVDDLTEVLGLKERRLPWMVTGAGAFGLVFALGLLWYIDVMYYPTPVGGLPLEAWTAYGLPAFEFTVLLAALTAVIGMLALNRLPRLHHPLFEVEAFDRATQDGFFLVLLADDPHFDPARARDFLEGLDPAPALVREVPA